MGAVEVARATLGTEQRMLGRLWGPFTPVRSARRGPRKHSPRHSGEGAPTTHTRDFTLKWIHTEGPVTPSLHVHTHTHTHTHAHTHTHTHTHTHANTHTHTH